MNNNFNLDENMMNKIKNMVDNGNISDAISQISPEMLQNFSNLMNQNNDNNNSNNNNINNNNNNSENSNYSDNSKKNNFPNLGNLDMDTMMKITSVLSQMNDKNDPRANLLYSLKPYLRDSKKNKLDQYAQLLNISKIADIMKNDKKENNSNA